MTEPLRLRDFGNRHGIALVLVSSGTPTPNNNVTHNRRSQINLLDIRARIVNRGYKTPA